MPEKNALERMDKDNVWKLILIMAVPGLLANVSTSLYNLVNQLFVGRYVGSEALGAIAILAPYVNILNACNVIILVGGCTVISMDLGRKRFKQAEITFTSMVSGTVALGLILFFVVQISAPKAIVMFGAVEGSVMYQMALSYVRITTFGFPLVLINQALMAAMRSEGNIKFSMVIIVVSGLLNVCLNAMFLVVFRMGIEGAAYATLISQVFSVLCCLIYYKKGQGQLRFRGIRVTQIRVIGSIVAMGIAPAIFQVLSMISNIILNRNLRYYGDLELTVGGGDLAIAALAVVITVENLLISMIMGVNGGISPLISYNYGKKNFRRVISISMSGQLIVLVMGLATWGIMMGKPEFFFHLFSKGDAEIISYGAMAMKLSKPFVFLLGFLTLSSMYFSATGRPQKAVWISLTRQVMFYIPGLVLLPLIWGLEGVFSSSAISDLLSTVVVAVIYFSDIRKMWLQTRKNKEREAEML